MSQLSLICNIYKFLSKEFPTWGLTQSQSIKYFQHFIDSSVQFEIMLCYSHHTLDSIGIIDLNHNNSLCRSPKGENILTQFNPIK